jgi:hypothetical protein
MSVIVRVLRRMVITSALGAAACSGQEDSGDCSEMKPAIACSFANRSDLYCTPCAQAWFCEGDEQWYISDIECACIGDDGRRLETTACEGEI